MMSPKPRARDLGIPFEGTPGPLNAITDVEGVTASHVTLVSGEGKLVVGQGPVRTGLTAILPRGIENSDQVFAGYFSLNGNGEMTGMHWVEEAGLLEGPIMLTNTHSVGIVRDAVIEWQTSQTKIDQAWSLPVVAETFDCFTNRGGVTLSLPTSTSPSSVADRSVPWVLLRRFKRRYFSSC